MLSNEVLRKENVEKEVSEGKRLSAPEGVPRPSPTLVLTGPYVV